MDNKHVADTLSLLGDLIELAEDETFKARAYHSAARTLKRLEQPVSEMVAQGELGSVPGFGKALVEKVGELFSTGQIQDLEDLRASLPPGVIQMRKISGLGAKKIKILYREHGIDSLETLCQAAADGSLAALPGFGARSSARVAEGIEQVRSFQGKLRIPEALRISDAVCAVLSGIYGAEHVNVAGDLRRFMPVIENLRWVVLGSPDRPGLSDALTGIDYCDRCEVSAADTLKLTFSDSVVGHVQFASAEDHGRVLLRETGPRAFAARVLELSGDQSGTESQLLAVAGMNNVPAECRDLKSLWNGEATGNLLEPNHLRGVLHCHTNYSDGSSTLLEMAQAAMDRGLTYLGICDHSPSAAYAGGLTAERVAQQHQEIDRLNDSFENGFVILKGTESDIRMDGSLDFPDDVLATFDFVVASIHSQIDMDEESATDRICRALSNPYTTILGHPTARLLLKRGGYPLNWSRVIEAAAAHGVVIELNANPRRLDVDWALLPACFEAGIMTSINPDAHSVPGIDDMYYGVQIARKAGTTPDRVLNCMEQSDLIGYFEKRRP